MERVADEELRELMQRYQAGDQDAFSALYAATARSIERYVTRWVDPSRAPDVAQEAFLQIHRARRTYRPDLPVRPWMFAIARHVALQNVRSRGRRIVENQLEESQLPVATPSAEQQIEARDRLEQALRALPDDQRESVWLADVEGFTSTEIAKITGATDGAVRVRLHRAHQKLKLLLAGLGVTRS